MADTPAATAPSAAAPTKARNRRGWMVKIDGKRSQRFFFEFHHNDRELRWYKTDISRNVEEITKPKGYVDLTKKGWTMDETVVPHLPAQPAFQVEVDGTEHVFVCEDKSKMRKWMRKFDALSTDVENGVPCGATPSPNSARALKQRRMSAASGSVLRLKKKDMRSPGSARKKSGVLSDSDSDFSDTPEGSFSTRKKRKGFSTLRIKKLTGGAKAKRGSAETHVLEKASSFPGVSYHGVSQKTDQDKVHFSTKHNRTPGDDEVSPRDEDSGSAKRRWTSHRDG
eukprot:TRINITY_DN2597_c0_g1_i2.p1 TRINITY_DN2597_c0_g1~~TRINITY_DN2597_c0_g1_i2.p1  ORF type:complete len:282 (-),score=64.50 TRINITY_DN2597_c0_g1_i2:163-1008(-)